MIYVAIILVLLCIGSGGFFYLRRNKAHDPASWPSHMSFDQETRMVRRYLKSEGWEPLPPMPWALIFIRAKKDNVYLNLIIQNEHTLGIGILIDTASEHSMSMNISVGIITRSVVTELTRADANRVGIYILSPSDLPKVYDIVTEFTSKRALAAKTRDQS